MFHRFALGMFMAGCVVLPITSQGQPATLNPATGLATTPPGCPADAGADLVPAALRTTRVVAFGETHGTQEHPRLVGDYVCALLRQDRARPVVLALEWESADQPLVDAYLDSPGHPDDVARLLTGVQWHGFPSAKNHFRGYQDGRASQAGLALMERMRRLRAAGYPVSIHLFIDSAALAAAGAVVSDVPAENGYVGERIAAESMLRSLAAHPDARFVIEAGGSHIATRRDAWDRPGYVPMGQRLRQAGVDIVALNAIYGGEHNTNWSCDVPGYTGGPVDDSMVRCEVYPGPKASVYHATPVIRLDAFDGTFYVPSTNASPPAIGTLP